LYKQYVLTHLDFAVRKKDKEVLEQVQIKAVNMVTELIGKIQEDKPIETCYA
jgi:hypothetical protein